MPCHHRDADWQDLVPPGIWQITVEYLHHSSGACTSYRLADGSACAYGYGTAGDITPVHAYSSDGFFIRNSLVHLQFVRDVAGQVSKVVVHRSGAADDNLRITA